MMKKSPPTFEVNLDGLVGQTHHYAGLAEGNIASKTHEGKPSNPKAAALQGLAKMQFLHRCGIRQMVMPPHPRPHLAFLTSKGLAGSDAAMIEGAYKQNPKLVSTAYSSSFMWTANAATIAPSSDTADGKLHITPANLISSEHRALEAAHTAMLLKTIFSDPNYFVHHPPLSDTLENVPTEQGEARSGGVGGSAPIQNKQSQGEAQSAVQSFSEGASEGAKESIGDEGAANHMRLTMPSTGQAVHVFVYGRDGVSPEPSTYPARQHLAASRAVAGTLKQKPSPTGMRADIVVGGEGSLKSLSVDKGPHPNPLPRGEGIIFIQQSPAAIDAGVFHNDVIATSNAHLLLYHEAAFADGDALANQLIALDAGFVITKVTEQQLSLADAVKTYLFNSQIVTLPEGGMLLLAPIECETHTGVKTLIDGWLADPAHPICEVNYMDVRQSMDNGGGPACLRLRITMNEAEWNAAHDGIKWDDTLFATLKIWVEKHYRDQLILADLRDPALMLEVHEAMEELAVLLGMSEIL